MTNKASYIPPIHPGEILKEEFLDPIGISQRAFARSIDVPANRVNEIVRGKRSITGDHLNFAYIFGFIWIEVGISPTYKLCSNYTILRNRSRLWLVNLL